MVECLIVVVLESEYVVGVLFDGCGDCYFEVGGVVVGVVVILGLIILR